MVARRRIAHAVGMSMSRAGATGGEAAVERAAVLGVIAVIVVVLASGGIGRAVAGTVGAAVCSITSGDDCGGEVSSEPPIDSFVHRDAGGSSGPTFGSGPHPIPGIPWDGSVSVGERSTDEPGLYLEASIEHDRSKCRLDATGTRRSTLA